MGVTQSLCAFNGQLYAAWKGITGDDRLFVSHFNGTAWAPQVQMVGFSSVGPSLTGFRSSLIAGWKGLVNDERLFVSGSNGTTWNPETQISNTASSTGPALAALGNHLYAVWKGMGSDQALWYASSSDGVGWSAQAVVPGVGSSIGPSLAAFNGKLYMAWKGINNDQSLWYASFDGTHWSPQASIPGVASSVGPSLAVFGGKLYAAWKGVTGDSSLWYASFDGTRWSAQAQIPGASSPTGPALSEYTLSSRLYLHPPSYLYAMWPDASGQLHYAFFNGSTWSAVAAGPGSSGQDVPVSIGLRMQYQESSQWCWIAVGTSIALYYNPACHASQCDIMTTIGQNINKFPKNTSACPTGLQLRTNPALREALADPYTTAAEYILDNPALGIPTYYLKSGGVGDALNVYKNWKQPYASQLTLQLINTELSAGRPIALDIQWKSGGQHCIAIVGVLDDKLLIADPVIGETVIQFEQFPSNYSGGATLVSVALTQKGS